MPKLAVFSILLAMLYKALAFFFLKEKDNLLLRNRTFSLRFSHKYDTVFHQLKKNLDFYRDPRNIFNQIQPVQNLLDYISITLYNYFHSTINAFQIIQSQIRHWKQIHNGFIVSWTCCSARIHARCVLPRWFGQLSKHDCICCKLLVPFVWFFAARPSFVFSALTAPREDCWVLWFQFLPFVWCCLVACK